MEREEILNTINNLECLHVCEGLCTENQDVLPTIKADIERQRLNLYLGKDNKKQKRLYKLLLYKVLTNLCIKYSQGMCEVSVVIINLFLKDAVMNFELDFLEDDDINLFNGDENVKKGFQEFCNLYKKECKKTENSIHEMFIRTYEPLWKNGLKLHKKYNEVFLKMMKEQGIDILKKHPLENLTHILTFFTRICANEKVIYRIFNIILTNDVSILYTLLILLYKHTDSETGSSSVKYDNFLKKLPEDFEEQVEKTNKKFLETQKNLKKNNSSYFILGIGISLIVAGGIAFYNKKK